MYRVKIQEEVACRVDEEEGDDDVEGSVLGGKSVGEVAFDEEDGGGWWVGGKRDCALHVGGGEVVGPAVDEGVEVGGGRGEGGEVAVGDVHVDGVFVEGDFEAWFMLEMGVFSFRFT